LTGHVYGPHIVLIGKKLWDSFPAGDQKIIAEAAQESAVYQRSINRKMNRDFVDNLRKAGVTVTELTPAQHKAFVDAVASVYVTWEPKIGKALLDEFRATVSKAR
jgi:TRAP-type C4-dicarboxylate transport system substrate-binding protein